MVQAILMVIISQPFLTHNLGMLVALGNEHIWEEPRAFNTGALSDLRAQVALARRFLRMFRFLECFQTAHRLYASLYSQPPSPPAAPPPGPTRGEEKGPGPATGAQGRRRRRARPPAEAWLDLSARTFNGMYLLLEALTLADALGLPLLGRRWSGALHVEGQRFWFLALACGAAGGAAKLATLLLYAPAPPARGEGEGAYGTGEEYWRAEAAMADWERERERLRRIMWPRRDRARLWRANVRARWWGLARRCVADLLDLAAPGDVVGWFRFAPGTLGALQVVTTYLTGMEVWERCGREVAEG